VQGLTLTAPFGGHWLEKNRTTKPLSFRPFIDHLKKKAKKRLQCPEKQVTL
jgi:hypothetical protein